MIEQPVSLLDTPGALRQIAVALKSEVDALCIRLYDDGPRTHLGASIIGHQCRRFLWYEFRWVKHVKLDGRKYRIFNRGHREEAVLISYLRGIGATVWEFAEDQKQFRISGSDGHFGGSLDGVIVLPPKFGINEPLLLEFKTSNESRFKQLRKDGMPITKPMHFAQTSTYGYNYGFKYLLYVMVNKNDDDLEFVLIKLDWNLGRAMMDKADEIIRMHAPPPRLSENPQLAACKSCEYNPVCHQGGASDKNCRSCVYAFPAPNKQWACSQASGNNIIPIEVIRTGCGNWKPIAGN